MSKIAEIKSSFEAEVKSCVKISEVQDMKVKYLGKSGELTALLKEIKICLRRNVRYSVQKLTNYAILSKTHCRKNSLR